MKNQLKVTILSRKTMSGEDSKKQEDSNTSPDPSDHEDEASNNIWTPNVLVLGPGGVKGFIELGAITFLENRGFIDRVNTIVGCSVGSIIGLLLIVGYTSLDIITEVFGTALFDDIGSINFKDVRRNTGLMGHEAIRETLTALIRDKMGMVPTLEQLHSSKGIDFCVVTYNLTDDKAIYITAETDPDLSCIDAIILSCNIPLIFYRSRYRDKTFIDGAFGDPYPILKYDIGENQILGLYIDSEMDDNEDGDTWWYVNRVIRCSMNELRRRSIQASSDRCRHLPLTTKGLKGNMFSYTMDDRRRMLSNGYSAASDFYQEVTGIDINEIEHPHVLGDSDALKMVHSTEGHVYFTDVDDTKSSQQEGSRAVQGNAGVLDSSREQTGSLQRNALDSQGSSRIIRPHDDQSDGDNIVDVDISTNPGIVIEVTPRVRKELLRFNKIYPGSAGHEIIRGSSDDSSNSSETSSSNHGITQSHRSAKKQQDRSTPKRHRRWRSRRSRNRYKSESPEKQSDILDQMYQLDSDSEYESQHIGTGLLSPDTYNDQTPERQDSRSFPVASLEAMRDLLMRKAMNDHDYQLLIRGDHGNVNNSSGYGDGSANSEVMDDGNRDVINRSKHLRRRTPRRHRDN